MSQEATEKVDDPRARSAETKRRNSSNKILGAAALRFHLDGYATAKIEDIAEHSMSAATIYNHFHAKDRLGLAVLEDTFSSMLKATESDPDRRPRDVLTVGRILQDVLSCYDGIGFALVGERERTDRPNSELIPTIYEHFRATITDGQATGDIRTDFPAESMADLLIDTIVTDSLLPSADPEQSLMRLTILADGMRAGSQAGE
jgi:AcrR family transcriptional regulator